MNAPQCSPDLGRFWSRLTELICGGETTLMSLRAVEKELAGRPMAAVVKAVADDVENGAPLFAALRKHTEVFGRAVICFVEGGEYAGILDRALLFILDGLWHCPTCTSWNPHSEGTQERTPHADR